MTLYFILLFVPSIAAIIERNQVSISSISGATSVTFKIYFLLLFLAIGLRHEVGGDWVSYLNMIDTASQQNFTESMDQTGDIAYKVLTWLSAQIGTGIYGVNLVCSAIFAYGLMVFCRNNPRPWLSLAVAVPYLVIVVAMGYTRQGVAIGLVMIGLVALEKGNTPKFVMWVVLSALFHKTALIMIPLAIFSGRKNLVAILGVLLTAAFTFILLLAEFVDQFVAGYITDQYASSGAAIRIAMNALPALVLLIFRNRFNLTGNQETFWRWMALGGLAFIALLAISPSSTAVDRLALYWIPIQLYVLCRLPAAMTKPIETQLPWVIGILLYSLFVQIVWLIYSENSLAWLPYQFYPWVWLWQ